LHYMSKHLGEYLARLDDFFEKRAAQGLGVPESLRYKGTHSAACIANATGITVSTLDASPALLERINEWVQKIGYSHTGNKGADGNALKREHVKLVTDYIALIKQRGRKFPENPKCSGVPDWGRISSESGMPVASVSIGHTSAGKLLREAIKEVGLEVYPETEDWNPLTYGELLKAGSEWRKEELKEQPSPKPQLYNTRSNLRHFMLHAGEHLLQRGFTEEDQIGVEMLEKFEETLRVLEAGIDVVSTRKTFSSQMGRWQSYYLRLCSSKALPRTFTAALECAMGRAAMTPPKLAEAAEVNCHTLNAWLRGEKSPAVESLPDVRRIELALSLPVNTLTSRIVRSRPKQFNQSAYPEGVTVDGEEVEVRGNKVILGWLRPLLPDDFGERSEDKRSEMCAWLIKNLIRPTTEWGLWYRSAAVMRIALDPLPPVVEEEFTGLAKFKGGKIRPRGMKREGSWVKPTEDLRKSTLHYFFGYLALPADAEDHRLRGLGLDPSLFSLAMLICPGFIEEWLRWKAKRRMNSSKEDSYSYFDADVLESVMSYLAPSKGWLRQKPELAGHLKPVAGFIDRAFIKRARRNWEGVCDKAVGEYKNLYEEIDEVAEEQRDPFELILPLLDTTHPQYQNPIMALRMFAQRIIADLPNPQAAPVRAAKHLRNYLIVRILIATALRSRNVRELTYRADNTGHLRRSGDKWKIVIPWKSFKNKHSSYFGPKKKKHDYEKVLPDKDGLYTWIEEYIDVHRPLLLKGSDSNIFVFNTEANPTIIPSHFYTLYRRLTMFYFAYNPYLERGAPGVKPHGPHCVRDILATFVLQLTGSEDIAAYMIQDIPPTIRKHYGRFTPKDKTRLVDFFLNTAWNGEVNGESSLPESLRKFLAPLLGGD
jgi:integrase